MELLDFVSTDDWEWEGIPASSTLLDHGSAVTGRLLDRGRVQDESSSVGG